MQSGDQKLWQSRFAEHGHGNDLPQILCPLHLSIPCLGRELNTVGIWGVALVASACGCHLHRHFAKHRGESLFSASPLSLRDKPPGECSQSFFSAGKWSLNKFSIYSTKPLLMLMNFLGSLRLPKPNIRFPFCCSFSFGY